ncbi:MAG: glycosyltransferase family 2 protein [Myxococcales bacterium]|nr:glycosyltransferase family 2 protein [Myxococcales bacterium]
MEETRKPLVSVVLPAHDEAPSLTALLPAIEKALSGQTHEILLVDDGSTDDTAALAGRLGARVLRQPYRKGNGAAVKRGIREAQGEIVLLMDADGQHDPADIPRLLEAVKTHDMAVGARARGSAQAPHRFVANRLFSLFASYLAGERIPDLTSGFRAVRAPLAKRFVELLPNTFSYPSTLTLLLARCGFTIAHVPILAHARAGKSKIRPLADGLRFLQILLKVGVSVAPFRVFLPVSLIFFLLGLGWYVYRYATEQRFTNMSVFLLCTAVIVFMMGLLAEGIAQLRRERRDE